jgi:putative ABC transport system permease protein
MKQAARLLWFSMHGLATRPGTCLVMLLGSAGVVVVYCFFFGLADGLAGALMTTGRDDRAIVLRRGSEIEAASRLNLQLVDALAGAQGVRLNADDKPVASLDIVTSLDIQPAGSTERFGFPLRGVSPGQAEARPELRIVAGRTFTPGRYEVIVGRAINERLGVPNVGDQVRLRGSVWTVTGIFSANGSALESEILADTGTLQSLYQSSLFSSALVSLHSSAAFDEFQASMNAHRGLDVEIVRERSYFERQAGKSNDTLRAVAYLVSGLIALAAMFAAINAAQAAVRARLPELATMRAIGFQRTSVIGALWAESIILSAAGAGLGVAIAWVALQGTFFSTLAGGGAFSQTAFALQLTPVVLGTSSILAICIGAIGGIAPAVKAGRLAVADALREA